MFCTFFCVLHIAIAVEAERFRGARGDAASRVSTLAGDYGGDSVAGVTVP